MEPPVYVLTKLRAVWRNETYLGPEVELNHGKEGLKGLEILLSQDHFEIRERSRIISLN